LEFEKANPEAACGIRYEDLVADVEVVADGLWKFLDLEPVDGLSKQMFQDVQRRGSSDHKVWFTIAVHQDSVGNGCKVPPEAFPPHLMNEINELLHHLHYEQITPSWGTYGTIKIPEAIQSQAEDARPQLEVATLPTVHPVPREREPVDSATEEVADGTTETREGSLAEKDEVWAPERTYDEFVESIVDAAGLARILSETPTKLVITEGAAIIFESPLPLGAEIEKSAAETGADGASEAVLLIERSALLQLIMSPAEMASIARRGGLRYYDANGRHALEADDVPVLKDLVPKLLNSFASVKLTVSSI